MALRSNWKGYLKLSLVSCPVALYPATSSSSRVKFNTLNRKTGNKVKRQFVDPDTLEEVDSDDQVKGYAVGKTPSCWSRTTNWTRSGSRAPTPSTSRASSPVPTWTRDISRRRITSLRKVGLEAFSVIRDAMRENGKAGIARVVIARRERIILLEPFGKGLVGTVLRYQYEVRDETPYFEDIPDLELPSEMTDLAEHIIKRKSGSFDPAKFEDRYENAMVALLKSKQTGPPVTMEAVPRPTNVVSLMDALRRSIAADEDAAAETKKAASKPRGSVSSASSAKRQRKKA